MSQEKDWVAFKAKVDPYQEMEGYETKDERMVVIGLIGASLVVLFLVSLLIRIVFLWCGFIVAFIVFLVFVGIVSFVAWFLVGLLRVCDRIIEDDKE